MTGLHTNLNQILIWQQKNTWPTWPFIVKQPNALLIFIEATFSKIWRYDNVFMDNNAWLPAALSTCNSYLDLTLAWRPPARVWISNNNDMI